jgi:hypothetical protein
MGWKCPGRLDDGIFKQNILFCKSIHKGTGVAVIAIATQVVSPQGVERDEDDAMGTRDGLS